MGWCECFDIVRGYTFLATLICLITIARRKIFRAKTARCLGLELICIDTLYSVPISLQTSMESCVFEINCAMLSTFIHSDDFMCIMSSCCCREDTQNIRKHENFHWPFNDKHACLCVLTHKLTIITKKLHNLFSHSLEGFDNNLKIIILMRVSPFSWFFRCCVHCFGFKVFSIWKHTKHRLMRAQMH